VSSTRSARHTALITAILACSASTAFAQAVRIAPATSVRGVPSTSATIKIREATQADAAATTITDDDTGVVIDASEGAMLGQDAATTALALAQAQAQANAIPFTPDELIELKKIFESLEEPQQDEMRAFYADLAVDLDAILGITAAKSMQAQRAQMIAGAMRELDFTRKPEAVLAARAKLGFGQVAHPNPDTAQPMDLARWIHLQVMAGEWATFAQYISTRPLAESEPMYAAILQSMNRGDTGLLPEEVLAFAEASPSEFKPWQLTALGKMLENAGKKYSTGAMLQAIREGTRLFGTADEATRRRTIDFLAGGGLLAEAYQFLPPLEDARAAGDGALLLVHARYLLDLATKAGEGPEGEALRLKAFTILCEATLLERESFEHRRDALSRAIALINSVPRVQVSPWLSQVFASPSLGPAALELMALTATSIGNMQLDVTQRAKAILSLKESVDILLARDDVDSATLRVPLRMLTTALVTEMEQAINERGAQRFLARESQLLLRAIPSEKWLKALEPSLATRARIACICLATVADETDLALTLLDNAIAHSPAEAALYADQFLAKWTIRLAPMDEYQPEMMMMYSFYRDGMPMAPLTRGRQRRNLDHLDGLMTTLRGAGVDPRALPSIVGAFKACHARTEVYERSDITRIFGDVNAMPAATAAGLASTMGASLNGDWRSRAVQKAVGTKRTDSEVALLVDRGYGLALELLAGAIANRPDAWNLAILNAALSYDRLQFKQAQTTAQDPVKQNEYRKAAFEAFGNASARYVAALAAGETRDDPTVYRRWFGAAMGTAELNFLRSDDLPKEGTLQDDQIDLIRKSIATLERESADRHLAAFASDIEDAVTRAEPEVKPRLVRHALRVIGDHSAGASLRAMEELYRDLVKHEIKLRLAIDGSDDVGVKQPFGALLSLRFTHSVDRETGGFSKYLQNGVFGRVGNSYRQMNYRDELQKTIERSIGKDFEVVAVGFFDAFMPPRGVVEDGQDGWLEKPLAYLVLSRRDASTDRVSSVVMDMQFTDQTGPVTLEIPSNTPLLSASTTHAARPMSDLTITQLVDTRAVADGAGKDTVTLEVRMRGSGVLPDLRAALQGLDTALAGYTLASDAIVADPPIILQEGDSSQSRMAMMTGMPGMGSEPKDGYPEADANGMFHLPIEQSFKVTYTRALGAVGSTFTLPVLAAGVSATLESRYYADLDIMPVTAATVPVITPLFTPVRMVIFAGMLAAFTVIAVLLRRALRRAAPVASTPWSPARITPLGVVTSLRKLERDRAATLNATQAQTLRDEIRLLELKYFGPSANDAREADLNEVVERWSKAAK
jgi:hypothetical protein